MRILIYDCEIANAIPSGEQLDGIWYCGGWTDYKGMKISVIGWQWHDHQPEIEYSAAAFAEVLQILEEDDYDEYAVVTFNGISFDDKLMAAHGVQIETTHDLLVEVRAAAGYRTYKDVPKGFSYKLDAIAQANGMTKTGRGDLAPILWQQGRKQAVVDYCLMDVKITRAALDLGLAGELIDPNTGNKLQLPPINHSSARKASGET